MFQFIIPASRRIWVGGGGETLCLAVWLCWSKGWLWGVLLRNSKSISNRQAARKRANLIYWRLLEPGCTEEALGVNSGLFVERAQSNATRSHYERLGTCVTSLCCFHSIKAAKPTNTKQTGSRDSLLIDCDFFAIELVLMDHLTRKIGRGSHERLAWASGTTLLH